MKTLYTAFATASGGRDGKARTDDGRLEVDLSVPEEMGGDGGKGTNPEQMFAAGYAACFIGAMKFVADKENLEVPEEASVRAEVGIGPQDKGFGLDIDLHIKLPGMDKVDAEKVANRAHEEVCPYSNATRNNVDVRLHIDT
ncbi:organic hydroperoxide resistance protein [Microbulbifer flavimaris]|uniref:Organic hydroperoxide resistance protein n=1 Tax=Microbulbifer flavimaris TaxID=1781068 RepID=A0ABX4I0L0_9GAMM|nr:MULTISPECIES: organic hydroperoxide resistance protein [Microbulbifer]KUJ83762.1 organic hydroperoxide resistance protein [Microbulbifer sp. ZGT114]PCO05937.1 organic hydroperoxide resistance protein [Microbulbifer flavimaris]